MTCSLRVLALAVAVGCSTKSQSVEAPPTPAVTDVTPTAPSEAPAPEAPPPADPARQAELRATARDKLRARDYAGAAAVYELSCNDGDVAGCTALADMLDNGRGVPEDPDRARLLYQQGCAAGLQQACDKLGH